MKIESIHLQNYRSHASLELNFETNFNVIVGLNGSGKTSVLKAICDALTGYSNWLSLPYGDHQALNEPNVARLQGDVYGDRYRFEPQYPVRLTTVAIIQEKEISCRWTIEKSSQIGHAEHQGKSPGQIYTNKNSTLISDNERQALPLPIVAFYRANRHWNHPQPHEMQAATTRNARTDGYNSWWDASLDSSALQAWVISKSLERLQVSSESGLPFDKITSDELALVNLALREAVEGIKGLKYDLRQKSVLIEWFTLSTNEPRQPIAFENLSDGQRAVIGLVADIARRMCVINPHLGHDVTSRTPGVVLIDELDMHLHPKWQRILTGGLKRAFPSVQFIVASHSPQVLGELQPNEIILLRTGSTIHPQVSYGLTSSQVLEEIMGANARAPKVEKMLALAFESLERGELEIAREKLNNLEGLASGIPELPGAWALLRRKEVLGR